MPNVQEGLTENGKPVSASPNSDDAFEQSLARAVAKNVDGAPPPTPEPEPNNGHEPPITIGDFKRSLLAPTETTNVQDGLTIENDSGVEDDVDHQPFNWDDPQVQQYVAQGQAQADAQEQRLVAAETELAGRDFDDRMENAETRSDVIEALADLQVRAPDLYAQVLPTLEDLDLYFVDDPTFQAAVEQVAEEIRMDEDAVAQWMARQSLHTEATFGLQQQAFELTESARAMQAALDHNAAARTARVRAAGLLLSARPGLRPGDVAPPADRVCVGGFACWPRRLAHRPRHAQLRADHTRLRGPDRGSHTGRPPRQHHALLADQDGRLFGAHLLGEQDVHLLRTEERHHPRRGKRLP
jgi:hypothetical protein